MCINLNMTHAKDAKNQAGGLAEISRGLSEAIPPVGVQSPRHSEGVLEGMAVRAPRKPLRPLQGRARFVRLPGVSAALRLPQPPANFWQPSRLKDCAHATQSKRIHSALNPKN
jgi:hypothetical protein